MSLLINHADRVHWLFSLFVANVCHWTFSIAHVHTFLQMTSSRSQCNTACPVSHTQVCGGSKVTSGRCENSLASSCVSPMQASHLSFAVPTHTLGRDKGARQAADRELLEWQQQRAARLGLCCPPKPQNARCAGRPSFGRLWMHALEQAIRDGHLPEHVESASPSQWGPGMPVWRRERLNFLYFMLRVESAGLLAICFPCLTGIMWVDVVCTHNHLSHIFLHMARAQSHSHIFMCVHIHAWLKCLKRSIARVSYLSISSSPFS